MFGTAQNCLPSQIASLESTCICMYGEYIICFIAGNRVMCVCMYVRPPRSRSTTLLLRNAAATCQLLRQSLVVYSIPEKNHQCNDHPSYTPIMFVVEIHFQMIYEFNRNRNDLYKLRIHTSFRSTSFASL